MRKALMLMILIALPLLAATDHMVIVKVPLADMTPALRTAGVAIDSTFGQTVITNSKFVVFQLAADSLGDTLRFQPLREICPTAQIIGVEFTLQD